MKRLMILAISAILVANVSAQESKREYAAKCDELFQKNAPAKKEPGKELTDEELDQMAKKRFVGFKELAVLQEKFYDKFRKDLSARQVAQVLIFKEPFDQKPEAFGPHPFPGKPDGKCHPDGFQHGPKPDAPKAE